MNLLNSKELANKQIAIIIELISRDTYLAYKKLYVLWCGQLMHIVFCTENTTAVIFVLNCQLVSYSWEYLSSLYCKRLRLIPNCSAA